MSGPAGPGAPDAGAPGAGAPAAGLGTWQCTVLDVPDVHAAARFYRLLLGGDVDRPDPRWSLDDHWSTLHLPAGTVLAFQRADPYVPPRWPDPGRPQQVHLDVEVADPDRARDAVLAAGATLLQEAPGGWRVYADPAGHPFCLLPAPAR